MLWQDKVRVWESYYLQGTRIEAIRRVVGQDDITPSWDTVKRVIDGFPLLTQAQVQDLPDALRARWRELKQGETKPLASPYKGKFETAYPDINAILLTPELEIRHKAWILHWLGLDEGEIAEKLGISPERARRYIEETVKKGVGKMKGKELKETLNASWLMSRFLGYLTTPNPCQIFPIGKDQTELNERLWVEEDPQFPKLKKLLDNKFWGKFAHWKKARVQYREKYNSFLDAVRQRAEEESQMKITNFWEEKALDDAFWHRICTHVLWKTNPKSLSELEEGYVKDLESTQFNVKDSYLVVERENSILAKGQPVDLDRVSKAYWSLVTEFTSVSEEIWQLWQELNTIEEFLNAQARAMYDAITPEYFKHRDTVVEI